MEVPTIQSQSYYSTDSAMHLVDCFPNTYTDRRIGPSWSTGFFNTNDLSIFIDKEKEKKEEKMSNRRLVKIIIVDPNENIPLANAVLVNEPEKFTDLEDQELFFELDIKNILDSHNSYRVTVVDKKASAGKAEDVYLEPVRIKDLKMVVLTIAEF